MWTRQSNWEVWLERQDLNCWKHQQTVTHAVLISLEIKFTLKTKSKLVWSFRFHRLDLIFPGLKAFRHKLYLTKQNYMFTHLLLLLMSIFWQSSLVPQQSKITALIKDCVILNSWQFCPIEISICKRLASLNLTSTFDSLTWRRVQQPEPHPVQQQQQQQQQWWWCTICAFAAE